MVIGRIDLSPALILRLANQICVSPIISANPRLTVVTRQADELLSLSHSINTRPIE